MGLIYCLQKRKLKYLKIYSERIQEILKRSLLLHLLKPKLGNIASK